MQTKATPTADAEFSNAEMLNPDHNRVTDMEKGGKQETLSTYVEGAVSTAVPAKGYIC